MEGFGQPFAAIPKRKRSQRIEITKEEYERGMGFEKSLKRTKKEGTDTDEPDLRMELKQKIQELGGSEVKLVIQKQLFSSDLRPNNGRFSIPIKKIRREAEDFLRETEEEFLDEREENGHRQKGLNVLVLDPCLRDCKLCLKKWKMERTVVYNLTHGWNSVVRNNHLKPKDEVQLWSFRINNQLCFALVKL